MLILATLLGTHVLGVEVVFDHGGALKNQKVQDQEKQLMRREKKSQKKSGATTLTQADFAAGTKRLTAAGEYTLDGDIEFNPSPTFPALDSTDYPQGGGYFLGFFAALTIEADGVTLDCGNNDIEMHADFYKKQRFFANIELGSRPFIAGAGPPPLGNPLMSPTALAPASNAVIKNCKLGLSSHHGIHGNTVAGITIQDSVIKKFEVAGIALNDATDVTISNVKIGPSSDQAFPAHLSQAIFLNHMTTEIGLAATDAGTGDVNVLKDFIDNTYFQLRGTQYSATQAFNALNNQLNQFLDNNNGDLEPLLKVGLGIPDGSAVYGILLHKTGPAVGDFGSGHLRDFLLSDDLYPNTQLTNVEIKDLTLAPEAWIALKQDCAQIQGPAGAVFRATHWQGDAGEYVGNALSDAQIAVGYVLQKANGPGTASEITSRANHFYGAANIPSSIMSWSAQPASAGAKLDFSQFDLTCWGDAMSHFNKGVIGLRLAYQQSPTMTNVQIKKLTNKGGPMEDESLCKVDDYKGNDVRAIQITNSKGVYFDSEDLIPGYGGETIDIMDKFT